MITLQVNYLIDILDLHRVKTDGANLTSNFKLLHCFSLIQSTDALVQQVVRVATDETVPVNLVIVPLKGPRAPNTSPLVDEARAHFSDDVPPNDHHQDNGKVHPIPAKEC